MQLIGSIAKLNVANNTAAQSLYYDYSGSQNVKTLDTIIIKNGQQYGLEYRVDPNDYSHYLSIAKQMINSFQFTDDK